MKLLLLCVAILVSASTVRSDVNITMWQADLQHTGQNLNETSLTPENIGSAGNFGYLFSQSLDGQCYGQPLLVSGIKVNGKARNVVYLATEHDSVYAFDADSNAGDSAIPLWHDSLLPKGTRPVPQIAVGSSDISVEVGITATPVIDTASNTLYVVTKIQTIADGTCRQYLHALDLATGAEKFGGPVLINPTFAGSADDAKNGVIPFNALRENLRSAVILYKGVVYICYASLSDINPYHGEILGYNASTLALVKTFITTPNGTAPEGGIWQGGAGPAIDGAGNMYVVVANGLWDQAVSPHTPDINWGESMLKLPTNTTGALHVAFSDTSTWFTPNIWKKLNDNDLDLGSTGLLLLPDQKGPHSHIMVGGSKAGVLYVVDRDDMGGIHTPDNAIQEIHEINGNSIFATPAYFNGHIYYSTAGGPLEQRAIGYDAVSGNYIAPTPIISASNYGGRGSGVFISANQKANGIAWILNGAGIDAYDATNISGAPIYSGSATAPPNVECQTAKFSLPIVANGKVYFTGFDNTNTGHLFVFGQLSSLTAPETPSKPIATAVSSSQIALNWTDNSTNEVRFIIKRAISPSGPFDQVGTVGSHVTSFTDTSLRAGTGYYYQVLAFNSKGTSSATPVAYASTFPFFTQPGLVAYWNLDDGNSSTVADVTGNGHNGTVKGEVVSAAGFINGAYTFHGAGVAASRISIPNTPALQFTTDQSFTLSAWINPAHIHGIEQAIIAKSADQGHAYGIWINVRNEWVFRGPEGDLAGSIAIQGEWTHVAVTQNGAKATRKIYVNGLLVGTRASAQAADGAGDLWLGQQNISVTPASFPGLIDEVRLYNRALPPSEITTLLGPPVLEAISLQGDMASSGIRLAPSTTVVTVSHQGATQGSYTLTLNFSSPVSGITADLDLQGGGSAIGHVDSINYDSTKKVVAVILTGVGNPQALNLHLTGIQPGNGTADVPFNVSREAN